MIGFKKNSSKNFKTSLTHISAQATCTAVIVSTYICIMTHNQSKNNVSIMEEVPTNINRSSEK
jgi:hypothetical protein